jgi:hypothetical protein
MLRAQPFQVRRTAAGPGRITASITLRLVDAIAPHRRTVTLEHVIDIAPAEEDSLVSSSGKATGKRKRNAAAAMQSRVVTFRTQEVSYDQDRLVLD